MALHVIVDGETNDYIVSDLTAEGEVWTLNVYASDGTLDGVALGNAVVGACVGVSEGVADGRADGAADGVADGAEVGAAVVGAEDDGPLSVDPERGAGEDAGIPVVDAETARVGSDIPEGIAEGEEAAVLEGPDAAQVGGADDRTRARRDGAEALGGSDHRPIVPARGASRHHRAMTRHRTPVAGG